MTRRTDPMDSLERTAREVLAERNQLMIERAELLAVVEQWKRVMVCHKQLQYTGDGRLNYDKELEIAKNLTDAAIKKIKP